MMKETEGLSLRLLRMNRVLLLLLLFVCSHLFSEDTDKIIFSHHAGFYDDPFYLKIKLEEGVLYYYDERHNRILFPDSLFINQNKIVLL